MIYRIKCYDCETLLESKEEFDNRELNALIMDDGDIGINGLTPNEVIQVIEELLVEKYGFEVVQADVVLNYELEEDVYGNKFYA